MRGKRPIPTALHLLRGQPSKRPLPKHEPTPTLTRDTPPPEHLSPAACDEWRRLAPLLERVRVLAETDVDALAMYCETFATWKDATHQIRKYGLVLKDPDKPVPVLSPFVKVAESSLKQARALLVEFGLTPAARSRIHAAHAAAPTRHDSKWGALLP